MEARDEGGGLDMHVGGGGGEEGLSEFSIANRLAEDNEDDGGCSWTKDEVDEGEQQQ